MAPTMSLHGGPLYASLPSLSMEQPLALTKNSLDAGRPAGLSPTLAPVERQQVCLCWKGGTPSPGCAGGTSCVGDSVCAPLRGMSGLREAAVSGGCCSARGGNGLDLLCFSPSSLAALSGSV